MTVSRTILPYAVAAGSGALLSLCYAPSELEAFAWTWMIPLLWILWFTGPSESETTPLKSARRGALLGFASGAAFFLINLGWVHTVSSLGAVVLSLYLAIYFGAWGAVAATVGRPRDAWLAPPSQNAAEDPGNPPPRSSPLLAGSLHNLRSATVTAAAWTSTEWLRGILFTGFGWNGLGVALHENLALVQIADVVGVTGISFLLMFCGCIATGTIRRLQLEFGRRAIRPHIDFHVTVIAVILVFFYGLNRLGLDYDDTVPLRSLIVQPNIPIDDKRSAELAAESYEALYDLTTTFTETSEIDLVLWPETALYYEFYHEINQRFLNQLLEGNDFSLILGTEEADPPDGYYNSIALVKGSTRNHKMHRKIHLVPFGEYIPLRKKFPPFEWIAGNLITGDFSRGSSYEPLKLDGPDVEIIPLICFEDTLGRLVRRFVTTRTQLIVNVTNDGWFLESSAAKQHFANARFRCIELKRPMIRAANTGVSCFIDHVGSLHDRTKSLAGPAGEKDSPRGRYIHDHETGSHFVRGALIDTLEVPRNPPITLYARYGDLFSQAMLALTVGALLVQFTRSRFE